VFDSHDTVHRLELLDLSLILFFSQDPSINKFYESIRRNAPHLVQAVQDLGRSNEIDFNICRLLILAIPRFTALCANIKHPSWALFSLLSEMRSRALGFCAVALSSKTFHVTFKGAFVLPPAFRTRFSRLNSKSTLRFNACADSEPDRSEKAGFSVESLISGAKAPEVDNRSTNLKDFLPPSMRDFVDSAGEDWQRELELAEHNRDIKAVAKPKKRPDQSRSYDISVYSIAELADDYHVPPEWLIEVLIDIGFELPIRLSDTLTDLDASDEDIQELIDRIHGVSREDVLDWYTDDTLEELAEEFEVDLEEMLAAATEVGIILSLGPNTHIRHEQKVTLFKRLGIYS
jgi:hypothetical protein